jgi:hypothetical protein
MLASACGGLSGSQYHHGHPPLDTLWPNARSADIHRVLGLGHNSFALSLKTIQVLRVNWADAYGRGSSSMALSIGRDASDRSQRTPVEVRLSKQFAIGYLLQFFDRLNPKALYDADDANRKHGQLQLQFFVHLRARARKGFRHGRSLARARKFKQVLAGFCLSL